MVLLSRGSVGSCCVVCSASSRSAWYALFTLLCWIQGVTPATLSAAGLVRATVCGPCNVGPRSRVSSPWPHLIPGHKFVNLFPKRERHPFLYKLSYLIYYLTQLFHLLWNLISPYLRQIFWHLFYYGRGPPLHNFVRRRAMGLWGQPESEQSHRKQVHLGTVSL